MEELNVVSNEKIEESYNGDYIKSIHKIGTVIMIAILIASFVPAFYVSFILGYFPGIVIIATVAFTTFSMNFFYWFLEPVMYFPMIGVTGSYISFVSGNISTMRIPAALAAQSAVNASPGTKKAEMAGALGMVSSVVVNIAILFFVILVGDELLAVMPEAIKNSLQFAVPGLYGAFLIILGTRLKR